MNRGEITTTLRWAGDWPWYAGGAVALLLAGIAWLLYRRDTRVGNRWLRLLLPALRALAVILIVLMLSGPVLHHRKVIGQLARLILCVDGSESMQLGDPSMDAGRKIAIVRRLGLLEGIQAGLDLPEAASALADARGIADRLPPQGTPDEAAWRKLSADFVAKIAAAEALLGRASGAGDLVSRFRSELVQPARELAGRQPRAIDDRLHAALELGRLGDAAGRWSLDISAEFQKRIDADPAAAPLKTALAKFDALPRWQRLQGLLLEGAAGTRTLERLATQHDVQVLLLSGDDVNPLWRPGARDSSLPAGLPKPVGAATNLTSALTFAIGDEAKAEKGAVVLLTDGQHNSGDPPLDAARILAGRNMPVFTVGFGSQVPPRDIAVLRTVVPDSVFFEDRVRGEIHVKEEVPPGEPFAVSVKDNDRIVWEKQLVAAGRGVRRVPFEFSIKEIAEARLKRQPPGYEISGASVELTAVAGGLDGERELANNSVPMRFRAVTQKRRILILDGRPRWETRYLRNLFERDEKWDVNSVVAGATSDPGFVRGEKPGAFPSDEKLLDAHDLIFFGEVPKAMLKAEEMRWLADFAGKRGGAIVFIDGPRGVLRDYAGTALAPLFPVEWTGSGARTGFKALALAGRGVNLGAFALGSEATGGGEMWARLPVPHFIAEVKALPGAEVLVEIDAGASRLPAAVMRRFGAGRVYYHAFDESWRWRYEVADEHHVRFWNQIAHYVAEPPFAARDKFVQLDAGQMNYAPGEQADIRVRLRDGEGRPVTDAAISAVLFRAGQRVAAITLSPDEGGLYRGRTAALEPGEYEVAVETGVVPAGQLKARAVFHVTARENVERTLLSLNEDLLRQISAAAGGEYLREEQFDDLVTRLAPLSSGRVIETDTILWQSWWWFALVIALLTVEWIIRKRAGML